MYAAGALPIPAAAILETGNDDRSDEIDDAFRDAEGIVDLSASVAASRKLAIDVKSNGRRIASFLSPSGWNTDRQMSSDK
jgi:hypothetical protein